MKKKIIFLICVFFLVHSRSVLAQQSEPVQIAELSKFNCEITLLHLDKLFTELQTVPDSIGYVVIYPKKNSVFEGLRYQSAVVSYTKFRGIDSEKIKIVRAAEKDEIKVEFWSGSKTAAKFLSEPSDWASIIQNSKTALIGEQYFYSGCADFHLEFFAEFLAASPQMNGKIVIYNSSIREAKKEAKKLLSELSVDYKIPQKRLKISYNTEKVDRSIKFWIISGQ